MLRLYLSFIYSVPESCLPNLKSLTTDLLETAARSQDGSQECHTRHHQLHGTTAQRERHTKQTKEKQGQFRVLSLGDLLAACFFPSEAGQKSLCWDRHDPTDFQWIQFTVTPHTFIEKLKFSLFWA